MAFRDLLQQIPVPPDYPQYHRALISIWKQSNLEESDCGRPSVHMLNSERS